jgi:hypothetical protein
MGGPATAVSGAACVNRSWPKALRRPDRASVRGDLKDRFKG